VHRPVVRAILGTGLGRDGNFIVVIMRRHEAVFLARAARRRLSAHVGIIVQKQACKQSSLLIILANITARIFVGSHENPSSGCVKQKASDNRKPANL